MGTKNPKPGTSEADESALAQHTEELLDSIGAKPLTEEEEAAGAPPLAKPEAQDDAERERKARDDKGRFTQAAKPEEGAKPAAAKAEGEQPEGEQQEEQEPEGGWRAEALRLRETRERERSGFQSTLQGLRERARQQPYIPQLPPQQQPQYQQTPPGVMPQQQNLERLPIEFDAEGKPFVPAAAMAPLLQQFAPRPQPMDPGTVRRTLLGRVQQDMINRDPINNAPVANRVFAAIETADQLVQAKQQELGGFTFENLDQVLDFMEGTGVAGVLREQYPDLLGSSAEDLETLVEGALTLNRRKLDRVLARGIAARTAAAQPQTPRPPAQLRALPASKPRSQAQRGAPAGNDTRSARLAELDAKNPMEWTKEEAKEYQRLAVEEAKAG